MSKASLKKYIPQQVLPSRHRDSLVWQLNPRHQNINASVNNAESMKLGPNLIKNGDFKDFSVTPDDSMMGLWILNKDYNEHIASCYGNKYSLKLSDNESSYARPANYADFELGEFFIDFDIYVAKQPSIYWQIVDFEDYLNSGFRISVTSAGKFKFFSTASNAINAVTPKTYLNEFVHVGFRLYPNGTDYTAEIYVNGVLQVSSTSGYTIPTGRTFNIGSGVGYYAEYNLYNMRFHSIKRTASEIMQMSRNTFVNDSNVLADWRFDNPDNYAQDHSDHPNDHTLTFHNHALVHGKTTYIGQDWSQGGGVLGPEIDTGTLTVDNFYLITASETNNFGTGLTVGDRFYAAGTETCNASNKVRLESNGTHLLSYNEAKPSKYKSNLYKYGRPTYLNGVNQYYSVPASKAAPFNPGTGNFSYGGRFRVDDASLVQVQAIYDWGNQSLDALWIHARVYDGRFRTYVSDGSGGGAYYISLNYVIDSNTFYDFLVTVDRATGAKLYINGDEVNSSTNTSSVDITKLDEPLDFGRQGGGSYFTGDIEYIAYWNKCLTASEAKVKAGLAAQWLPYPTSFLGTYERDNFKQKCIGINIDDGMTRHVNVIPDAYYKLTYTVSSITGKFRMHIYDQATLVKQDHETGETGIYTAYFKAETDEIRIYVQNIVENSTYVINDVKIEQILSGTVGLFSGGLEDTGWGTHAAAIELDGANDDIDYGMIFGENPEEVPTLITWWQKNPDTESYIPITADYYYFEVGVGATAFNGYYGHTVSPYCRSIYEDSVSHGVTSTDWNHFGILIDYEANIIRYYVNGSLLKTVTTPVQTAIHNPIRYNLHVGSRRGIEHWATCSMGQSQIYRFPAGAAPEDTDTLVNEIYQTQVNQYPNS